MQIVLHIFGVLIARSPFLWSLRLRLRFVGAPCVFRGPQKTSKNDHRRHSNFKIRYEFPGKAPLQVRGVVYVR